MYFIADSYFQETFNKINVRDEALTCKVFEECHFDHCSFINCHMEKDKFIKCRFESCIMSAVVPLNSRFQETRFFRSKLMGIDWTRTAELSEPEFRESQLNFSNFKLLKIPGIKICNCEAKEVDFVEADLSKG